MNIKRDARRQAQACRRVWWWWSGRLLEAQSSYETFVKDSNALIAQLAESISSKTKSRATAKMDSEQAKSDLDSTVAGMLLLRDDRKI